MFIRCKLLILMLALTLDGQVYAGKIVGGHEAIPHSRPYMVIMEMSSNSKRGNYCGGFLLNEDFVMTAAHCRADIYMVYLGVHKYPKDQNKAQKIPVEQAFPHNDYNPVNHIHDVMLLKLGEKARFNDNVKPIVLASKGLELPKTCQIAGWGRTNRTIEMMSAKLMEADVTITYNEMCEKESVYCSEGEVGQGKGDSGGPLVCDGMAYGVVSATYKSNNGGPLLQRFAKITDYKKWITSTIRKLRSKDLTDEITP